MIRSGVSGRFRLERSICVMAIRDRLRNALDHRWGQRAGNSDRGGLPGRLSDAGRSHAAALGQRRCNDGLAAIFVSDLERAIETVESAFVGALAYQFSWTGGSGSATMDS